MSVSTASGQTAALPVYDSSDRGLRVLEEARDLWAYRGLVHELVVRDIKVRYKRSVLGVTWTMLAPLLNMITLTIVFSALMKVAITNYPVYFMTGILFWNFFSQSTSAAALQTQDANEIAKKTFVPRSVFVAAAIGVALVNLVLSLVPLLLILAATRFPLHATWLFLPISILIGTLFAAGVALFLFTLATRFSDVREMYLVFIQVWFFLTPIVYHISIVPTRYRLPIWINPMYYLIQTFRGPIYDGTLPSAGLLAGSFLSALVFFLAGWAYFCHRADRFALIS
ncbi:MAG: ABC transporter permease [Thermoanaerobaculia bacterium]